MRRTDVVEVKRAIILVLDGLGIGAMPDVGAVRPKDLGTNTLLHVAQASGPLELPALARLGLSQIAQAPDLPDVQPEGAYGRSLLAYSGADTYMGHQELMGTIPGVPKRQRMAEVRDALRRALEAQGHTVEDFIPPSSMLLVDGAVLVADNMETDPGRNINVTAAYDRVPMERIVQIGEIVRSVVEVGRVIVVMGVGYDADDMAQHIVRGPEETVGVDSPGLGVYTERYRVRHLGIGVDISRQIPSIVERAGMAVYLLGKAADVVHCENAVLSREVRTADVLNKLLVTLQEAPAGLIVANVQEGDLAGHEENAPRWADVLRQVDAYLPRILSALGPHDLLMIAGDHGNDPTSGHSQHTREMTPLLVAGNGVQPVSLGTRSSLADVAATAGQFLGVDPPQDGAGFYDAIFAMERV